MKSLIATLMFLLASASVLLAQPATTVDARAFYEGHRHELAESVFKPASSKHSGHALFSVPGPGDNAQLVTLRLNTVFAEVGDRVTIKLIGLKQQSGFTIVGRRSHYDEASQTARADFFTPNIGGFAGWLPGLIPLQSVDIFSLEISSLDQPGEYQVDFALFDPQTGTLRQQVFVTYYVSRPSPFGRMYFRLDKAEIVAGKDGLSRFLLHGSFPKGEDLVVWFGNSIFSTTGFYQSPDGKTLFITDGTSSGREVPMDFVVLSPSARLTSTLPRGVVLPATPQNNVGVTTPVPTVP